MGLYMKKIKNNWHIFVATILFLVLCTSIGSVKPAEKSYIMPEIVNVVDGDTINIMLAPLKDYPPLNSVKVRINGIDTPESTWRAKCGKEKELGLEAKTFLVELIGNTKRLKLTNYKWGKFGGRIVADASVRGIDIAKELIHNGYAKEYSGKGSKPNWCE